MSARSSFDPKAELARARELALHEQFEEFSPRVLTWVGALPTWTAKLGSRLGLTATSESITYLVKRLEAEDLIETREILDAHGQSTQSFWLRPSLRPGLGRYLQQVRTAQLDRDLDELADAVQALDMTSATAGSIGSSQWLKIVRHYRRDPSGLKLMTEVDRLVATERLGEASTLVAAARAVGELASKTLFEAARRAQWRIDRAARIEHDVQRLRQYCPRPAIETAIRELVESAADPGANPGADPGQPWALHLLGDGGVGKTMLIRYLASGRFAEAHRMGRPFLVARADFDHLDPRYPEQRPAELLVALAADLVGVARTRELHQLLRLFQDEATALHEGLAGRGHRPGGVAADDLRETVGHFADFVNGLGAPVLLVLDTREELEKLYLPRAPAPAIDETFRLLELVHEAAPGVRVLFAGRRWLVPSPERSAAGGPLLRPRPYLRVVRVGGFTEAEALAYIDDRENPGSSKLLPGLRQALLDRSRSRSGSGSGSGERPDGIGEYSPFELAAYCDWAASDPGLDAERLRSAPGDPFVEWRIIGRLGDDQVRGALGVAAEFGRFDLTLVTPALTRAGIDATAAFDGLAAQEWVNVLSVDDDGGPAVIEIDEHLLERIRKVTARGQEWSPLDRRRLGEDARRVIEGEPLAGLPIETVEAAVRLLAPEAAATLWQRIEDKCCEERAWGWAVRLTERIAAMEVKRAEDSGSGSGSGSGSPTILAAIFATQAAATLHTAPGSDPSALWRQAEAAMSRHPDFVLRTDLRLRARLGRLATGDLTDTAILREALERVDLTGDVNNDLALLMTRTRAAVGNPRLASVIAAAYGCVSVGVELPDTDVPPGALEILAAVASYSGLSSAAAAARLAEAVRLLWTEGPHAAGYANAAISEAHAAERPDKDRADWADWAAPPRLADQCRLVRMIIAWRHGEGVDAVPWRQWRDEALSRLDDVSSERLAAATIRFELAHRPIDTEELARAERRMRYFPPRRLSWAHRQVGPLVVELAEAWRVAGQPERGADLLNARIDAAVDARTDPDSIEACQLAQLRLCRRERTIAYAPVHRLSREGSEPVRAQAWLVRTLVEGEQPRSPEEAGSWSGWWRCQDEASLARSGIDPPRWLARPPGGVATAEWTRLFSDVGSPDRREKPARPSRDFDPEDEVLDGRPLTLPPGSSGRALMSAAEVTALFLPGLAAEWLLDAARKLDAAGDGREAQRARLLACLAMARRGDRRAAENTWRVVEAAPELDKPAFRRGWQPLAAAFGAYRSQVPPPAGLPASPEIRLASPERRLPGQHGLLNVAGRWLDRYGMALATLPVGAAALVYIGILTAASPSAAGWIVAGVGGTVIARTLATGLPGRIVSARAIKVSQPGDSRVAAEAVPPRGVRDLRGSGFVTFAGAVAARWPFWTMFRPWHHRWAQSLSADPPPVFDLDGLRLPGRAGVHHLVILEIRTYTTDMPLPWEQWLGSATSVRRARDHLWYRRISGQPWTPSAREWRVSSAEYRGPSSAIRWDGRAQRFEYRGPSSANMWTGAPVAFSFRLLHIVGTPVPTSAGWRLRVADSSNQSRTPTRGAEAGELLLSVDVLPLNRMGLAVLQADPVDGVPQTLAGQRSGFMGCAQAMMDGGANAVLVIPPLPDAMAEEVRQTIWDGVANRRRPISPTALLRVQARVKRLVAAVSPAGDEGHHPVLDVLLFLRVATGDATDPTTERSN